jgi:hypothetical protein
MADAVKLFVFAIVIAVGMRAQAQATRTPAPPPQDQRREIYRPGEGWSYPDGSVGGRGEPTTGPISPEGDAPNLLYGPYGPVAYAGGPTIVDPRIAGSLHPSYQPGYRGQQGQLEGPPDEAPPAWNPAPAQPTPTTRAPAPRGQAPQAQAQPAPTRY